MDKTSGIGILLAVTGLICWNVYQSRQLQEYHAAVEAAREATAAKAAEERKSSSRRDRGGAFGGNATPPVAVEQVVPEQLEKRPPSPSVMCLPCRGRAAPRDAFWRIGGQVFRSQCGAERVWLDPDWRRFGSRGEKTKEPFKVTRDAAVRSSSSRSRRDRYR